MIVYTYTMPQRVVLNAFVVALSLVCVCWIHIGNIKMVNERKIVKRSKLMDFASVKVNDEFIKGDKYENSLGLPKKREELSSLCIQNGNQ